MTDNRQQGQAILGSAPRTWQNAALRVGEELASVGPPGYYGMTPEEWVTWALAALAAQEASPRLDVVSQAMSALETGSTHDQRKQAWNGLRDTFFPVEEASPQPEIARAVQRLFARSERLGGDNQRLDVQVDREAWDALFYLAARRQEGA